MLRPKEIVPWDVFVQRVRRHRPSELLGAIAIANAAIAPDGMWMPEASEHIYPWSLAVAARESIRAGNEHRPAGVSGRDLIEIASKYHNLYDPLVDDHDALAYLIRVAYEQFPYQEPLFYGLARSRLVFQKPSPEAQAELRIADSSFWERTLGCELKTLFTAGLLFGVGALQNSGWFDLGSYGQPNFTAVSALITEADATHAMTNLFSVSREEFQAMCPKTYKPGYERVAFNPLQARPFIRLNDSRLLAPVPQFVFLRASAPSLYYMALENLGEAEKSMFTDDVGTLFEDYVLRQARQLPIEAAHAEIEYRPGASTTDAILVWPDFIILVEAKATRLREESRIGGTTLREDLDRTIGRAFKQIESTAELIAQREPALAHIPADRPVFGLVVTLEPYYVVGFAREVESQYETALPVAVASIGEFERFVADCIGESLAAAEMGSLVSPNQMAWNMAELIGRRNEKLYRNPIMDIEFNELSAFPGLTAEADAST